MNEKNNLKLTSQYYNKKDDYNLKKDLNNLKSFSSKLYVILIL